MAQDVIETGAAARTTSAASSKRRKITAVLAGGLVLGVGAAVTLAAWNDSEFATGTFTAGSFTFQGSADGATFEDHASVGGAADLSFTQGFDNLTPGDTVYALYSLKLEGTSDATVTPVAPALAAGSTLEAGDLTFASNTIAGTTCDATAFAGGTPTASSFAMSPDDQVNLCLEVTAGSAAVLEQGETGDVVWQWNAVSQ
ncbi:hypothetical protein JD276_07445 [Leucobacter sp. CSA1]|uniref:SipW-cognate class signal peptide n=1 Tax=Leucobacter chromiisoli TaxID=2796471 RepID=A0A934UUI9_9MICO|nr:SipW-dependent-type signal peptide-containing protein [Leucobacter chromiisoli]MBK0418865.1 hypothetical protein [Leucobacter chromiisoli]